MNDSNLDTGKIKQEQLREILLRAYMRGENISKVNANDIIEEMAKNIKRLSSF
jgi:hypothetical protein